MQKERKDGSRLGWLAVAPALLLGLSVSLLGSDVPYWDEWELAPLLAAGEAGSLTFSDYLELHGGHRYVVPKLILTQVALATGWNVRVQLLLNLAIAFASFVMIALIAAPIGRGRQGGVALIGSSLAFFSFSQYDNWLWGWMVGFFLTIALIIAAIALLSRARWFFPGRLALAAFICSIATFSSGFGAVSWIALAPLVWMEASRPRHAVLAWMSVGAACIAAYWAGQPIPVAQVAGAEGPLDMVLFFVAVAGSPWTSLAVPAVVLGAFSLLLFVFLAFRALGLDPRDAMPWISVGLVALGFAALAAIVRSKLGWDIAASPRYATPMVLLTVATIQLAARLEPPRRRIQLTAILIGLLLFANLSFVPIFWSTASSRKVNRVCTDLAFLLGPVREDCVPSAYLDPHLMDRLALVRDRRLRPFADDGWYFVPPESGVQRIRVAVTATGISVDGESRASLLPEPILITSGAEREPLALRWPDEHGGWTARLDLEPLGASPRLLEIWTVPRHQKRLVRVGKWEM